MNLFFLTLESWPVFDSIAKNVLLSHAPATKERMMHVICFEPIRWLRSVSRFQFWHATGYTKRSYCVFSEELAWSSLPFARATRHIRWTVLESVNRIIVESFRDRKRFSPLFIVVNQSLVFWKYANLMGSIFVMNSLIYMRQTTIAHVSLARK